MKTEAMPYDEQDDDTGKFVRQFDDDDFLDAVEEAETPTTSNVAEIVGCQYRTAFDRLEKLEDAGRVEREKVNDRLVFWRLTDEDTRADSQRV
jgi:hypothetical protein